VETPKKEFELTIENPEDGRGEYPLDGDTIVTYYKGKRASDGVQ